ncbi:MAG: hypothetical protein O2960_07170 [Verrucomicrobia bacterium]|nr:hypothetical protein [Verrucomicrobiota bacterium]
MIGAEEIEHGVHRRIEVRRILHDDHPKSFRARNKVSQQAISMFEANAIPESDGQWSFRLDLQIQVESE